MFSDFNERLTAEIHTIKAALTTHESLRALLFDGEDGEHDTKAEPDQLTRLRAGAPPSLAWRIYDHCAAFTRLYAVYERFVVDLATRWIQMLPALYQDYADLPEAIRSSHRLGVAEILPRLGGDRFGHLSEQAVVRALYEGLTGQPYKLLIEAFLIDDTNLRHEALAKLCGRIGLADAWRWLTSHTAVQRYLEDVRGNASTAESELRTFVHYRNVAAHGAVEETVAPDEIKHIADFILILCACLEELAMKQAIARKLELGQAERIGIVIHRFKGRVVGAEMQRARIAVGEQLILMRDSFCYPAIIESLEINRVRHDVINADAGLRVGIQLSRPTTVDAALIRVLRDETVASPDVAENEMVTPTPTSTGEPV